MTMCEHCGENVGQTIYCGAIVCEDCWYDHLLDCGDCQYMASEDDYYAGGDYFGDCEREDR